jgi:DNA-binding transcriptional regulator YiaG
MKKTYQEKLQEIKKITKVNGKEISVRELATRLFCKQNTLATWILGYRQPNEQAQIFIDRLYKKTMKDKAS